MSMQDCDVYPKWNGKSLFPTKKAAEELDEINLDIDDVMEILSEGFDCSRSKRAENVMERCIQKGNKIYKIVIADVGDYWKIIHAGKFIASKKVSK